MNAQPDDRRAVLPRSRLLVLALVFIPATAFGWRHFEFLTDDAFIAFRYVSNAMQGYGLVWNPPPFRPVEGYTSWLWIQILLGFWKIGGLEPPWVANTLSLLFGYGTLAITCAFVLRMDLPASFAPTRWLLLGLVLLGTVANRTFLAWLSSGLETSLFNFCFTLWIYWALTPAADRGRNWPFALTLAAALTALTRPDGLMIVGATGALLALDWIQRPASLSQLAARLVRGAPLLAVPVHLIWRRWVYGEWLPNTYYAKYVSPWPESGWRYAASFVLEYAVWFWAAIALASLWRWRRPSANAALAVATVVAHVVYYTMMIGGDHFEYRIYSYAIPLLFVSLLWFTARLGCSARRSAALLAVYILVSLPVPWIHHAEITASTRGPFRATPIAGRFPVLLRGYANAFDSLQDWLLAHSVGIRQESHAEFYRALDGMFPPRAQGEQISWEQRPVIALGSVGVAGWRLPHVAVIDRLGLNDYLIARAGRRLKQGRRQMAHERLEPEGYVECFRPNVGLTKDHFVVEQRATPLTDADIIACERDFAAGP